MQLVTVRLGYALSLALMLSALIYFFASNWPVLHRWEKIGVSATVLALFYLASYVSGFFGKRHGILARWLLVAGGIAFGISVALLGQIYNSHADSYLLFGVWLIPNLLLAILTRYQPFYAVCFILAHLTLWFYLDPSVMPIRYEDEFRYVVFLLIAGFNAVLFWATSAGRLNSRPIHHMSLITFHLAMLLSSFLEVYGVFPGFLYLFILVSLFYTFLKRRPNRAHLIVTTVAGASFLIGKFFRYMIEYFSEGFFFLGLLAVAAIVWGTSQGLKWLRNTVQSNLWMKVFHDVVVVLVTAVASIVGAICLAGLLLLLIDDDIVLSLLYLLSLLVFVAPAVFVPAMQGLIRYTLLSMGYMLGVAVSVVQGEAYWAFYLLVLVLVWIAFPRLPARMLTQLAFLILLLYGAVRVTDEWSAGLVLIVLFQTGMYLAPRIDPLLRKSAFAYAWAAFLWLTGLGGENGYSLAADIAFFLCSTGMLYWTRRTGKKAEFAIVLVFWFAFLAIQYYDLAWSLLHKSFSLALLSILFFVVSRWLDRRTNVPLSSQQQPFFTGRRMPILLVILLQFALLGYQVWNSETILAKGETVKLELAPLDPRSLLQGDYVRLNYEISRLEGEDFPAGKKIRVVLRKQQQGVHAYGGYYQLDGKWNRPYQAQSGDVIINGRTAGWEQVEYGIESYFVPEGTGQEVERTARYALLKVGASGDAILERLLPE